jgi:hypothetical protein
MAKMGEEEWRGATILGRQTASGSGSVPMQSLEYQKKPRLLNINLADCLVPVCYKIETVPNRKSNTVMERWRWYCNGRREMEMVMDGREMEMVMDGTEMEMVMDGREMEMVMDGREMEMVMDGTEMEMVMDGKERWRW